MEVYKNLNDGATLKAEDVPVWFPVCINKECPRCGECLRYRCAQVLSPENETLFCVSPSQWESDDCRHFVGCEPVRMARGFMKLFDRVLTKHSTSLRLDLTALLHGPRIYYEYKRGERLLTPAEQEEMQRIVKHYGYDWEVPFAEFAECLCFPEILSAKVF